MKALRSRESVSKYGGNHKSSLCSISARSFTSPSSSATSFNSFSSSSPSSSSSFIKLFILMYFATYLGADSFFDGGGARVVSAASISVSQDPNNPLSASSSQKQSSSASALSAIKQPLADETVGEADVLEGQEGEEIINGVDDATDQAINDDIIECLRGEKLCSHELVRFLPSQQQPSVDIVRSIRSNRNPLIDQWYLDQRRRQFQPQQQQQIINAYLRYLESMQNNNNNNNVEAPNSQIASIRSAIFRPHLVSASPESPAYSSGGLWMAPASNTPIRRQRAQRLKMPNRFGKRHTLRMPSRFGRK